jgi:hypothetical protein
VLLPFEHRGKLWEMWPSKGMPLHTTKGEHDPRPNSFTTCMIVTSTTSISYAANAAFSSLVSSLQLLTRIGWDVTVDFKYAQQKIIHTRARTSAICHSNAFLTANDAIHRSPEYRSHLCAPQIRMHATHASRPPATLDWRITILSPVFLRRLTSRPCWAAVLAR